MIIIYTYIDFRLKVMVYIYYSIEWKKKSILFFNVLKSRATS